MKAVLCTHAGAPDDLVAADVPDPAPGPGQAVVDVAAAGLNFFDLLIVAGKYQFKPAFPFSPAAEFAGTVSAVGAGVTGLAAGDRVMGYCGWGAARERIAADAGTLVKLPAGLDFDRASGLSVTYGTSYYALKDRAGLKPGETLVVLGASGGVGLAAVELGKLIGARVIACASSDDKLDFARRHGADETVNYAREDLREALKRLGGERGIDVVYDPVGGPYAEAALRSLGWLGRFLVVGFAAGDIPKLPLNLVLLKSCDVLGVFWGAWIKREPDAHRANAADLVRWCADGKLSAHVHATYPLADAARALKDIADRKVLGKAVLRP
ncbi:MAG: NADPH:quinone oxidoreductase family protein [Alphaproteobacteria bacterium]|nr:NADPH:quinone oxidoreductase family protein [Alphaproteobacteria bacterium]